MQLASNAINMLFGGVGALFDVREKGLLSKEEIQPSKKELHQCEKPSMEK